MAVDGMTDFVALSCTTVSVSAHGDFLMGIIGLVVDPSAKKWSALGGDAALASQRGGECVAFRHVNIGVEAGSWLPQYARCERVLAGWPTPGFTSPADMLGVSGLGLAPLAFEPAVVRGRAGCRKPLSRQEV